uniref:Uncharacterized protein n=1 Tax=Ditylenchus dipsaci TaxID=166011 RepID=A0A915DU57_9BILA
MHNLSTISKTYGKHELKAGTPADGPSSADPAINGGSDTVVSSAIPARMNVSSSGISAGMAMSSSNPSSTALSLPQAQVYLLDQEPLHQKL